MKTLEKLQQVLEERVDGVARQTVALEHEQAVWLTAFSKGYEKAWDTMWPLMLDGVQKARQAIEQQAIDATVSRLNETVIQRAQELGQMKGRSLSDLREKRADFIHKRTQAQEKQDRQAVSKYDNYVEALDWMLNANGVSAH